MGVSTRDNRWWWDVLENGPSSVYASHFDIDWHAPDPGRDNVVLVPILGDHYGRELEAGHLKLKHSAGSFVVRYFEHEVPIAPQRLVRTWPAACSSRPRGQKHSGAGSALSPAPRNLWTM